MTNSAKFIFFNVGQGDATLLKTPNSQYMLIDNKGGGEIDVRSYLKSILPQNEDGKYILNYFMLTHAHNDHIGSVSELFSDFEIEQIIYTGFDFNKKESSQLSEQYKKFIDEINKRKNSHSDIEIAIENTSIDINIDGMTFEFLAPPSREQWDELKKSQEVQEYITKFEAKKEAEEKSISEIIHIGSIVCRISYLSSSVLITGDSELLSWKYWIVPKFSNLCNANLLHAAHHGSKGFFISKTDIEHGEAFDETTDGCYTDGLTAISPSVVIVTNKTKPSDQGHNSPPNEHAIKLYENFENTYRKIIYTSDGSIEYIIPDNTISPLDIDKRFKIQDNSSFFIKPKSHQSITPNIFG